MDEGPSRVVEPASAICARRESNGDGAASIECEQRGNRFR